MSPPVVHAANAAIGVPVIAVIGGWFHGILADATLLAGLILYSIQIYHLLTRKRRA